MSLSVSRLVNVTVSLSTLAAVGRSFTTLMIAGDSNVISGLQRYRTYTDLEDVAADFGTTAPEYLAAALYFGQSPQPATCSIGRWPRTATAAQNLGALLSPSQQAIGNFNAISNGSFSINIDGTVKTANGINFTGQTNLNGVAAQVSAQLSGGICTWNGQEFVITSQTSGDGYAATGSILFTGAGSPGDVVVVNGLSIELVSSSPSGNQVLIGGSAAETAANFQFFLMNSVNTDLTVASYSLLNSTITVTYNTLGVAGNAYTLTTTSSFVALSGATLSGGQVAPSVGYAVTGGTGYDISTLLGLTAATSIALVPGYGAETPVACAQALVAASTAWYGLMFAASIQPTDVQSLAVSSFIEALEITRLYGVTTQETGSYSSLASNDLGSEMQAAEYDQSFCMYSSQSPYAVASIFGRAFSVDFEASNSTIDLMYKQCPGLLPENLTDSQADVLESKNINVYASYDNGTQLIQYGICSGGEYIDTIQGADWFQNDVQTQVSNVLYTNPTKIPQTDPGVNQLTNACAAACNDAINNGFAAPGQWNGPSFGALQTGTYLKTGYYIYAPSVALQSQADRDERIAPPIQIALKLAGAINTVPDLLVTINQ